MIKSKPACGMNNEVMAYISRAHTSSMQETLGAIVREVLVSGRTLNRKAICHHLIMRLEKATSTEEKLELNELVSLLFSE
ncbi:regulatory protein YcgZ [Pantoea coffeiphila]|uniref:Two-component-system connector protein YcgZ n=1 Tax=Pantoea coffeiphila TaxID=1465635 RepID=A0A2S9ICT8_9GAMM|nr:regulatory protein YcgZ [Pantoea coffeiphila]PRD15596.1 hypothetical protein CQW29_11380 [Pantoea coffeiphila]